MNEEREFILRLDVAPIGQFKGEKEILPVQVHLHRFKNFDDAFMKLYAIPVNLYDKNLALSTGGRYFVEAAEISIPQSPHPLMRLEVGPLPKDHTQPGLSHLPNTAVYLNKGESHEFLTKGLRDLFRLVDIPELESMALPLANYDVTGTRLYTANHLERDTILGLRVEAHFDRYNSPFSVVITSHAYRDAVPAGARNGVTVKDTSAVADIRLALAHLLTVTDLNKLDPMIAYNSGSNQAISSAEVFEGDQTRRLVQLITMPYDGVNETIPKAGAYMVFDSPLARYLVESAVPSINKLSDDPRQVAVQIGHFDKQHSSILPTAAYQALQEELTAELNKKNALSIKHSKRGRNTNAPTQKNTKRRPK